MFKNNFVFDAISDAISKVIAEKIDPSVKTTDALQGPVPGGNDNGIRKPKVKLAAEEVEELDELSKGTLKSYAKKASSSTDERSASNLASRAAAKLAVDDPDDDGEKDDRKSFHRSRGISRAIDKLTKEESNDEGHPDEVEDKALVRSMVKKAALKSKDVAESTDTETKDASGKVTGWQHTGDWKKSTGSSVEKGKGKVAHLSDLARKKTVKMATEESEELEELVRVKPRGNALSNRFHHDDTDGQRRATAGAVKVTRANNRADGGPTKGVASGHDPLFSRVSTYNNPLTKAFARKGPQGKTVKEDVGEIVDVVEVVESYDDKFDTPGWKGMHPDVAKEIQKHKGNIGAIMHNTGSNALAAVVDHPEDNTHHVHFFKNDKKVHTTIHPSFGDAESHAVKTVTTKAGLKHLDKMHGLMKEEVELDEISKATLGSYVKKATKDARIHGMIATDFEHRAKASRKPSCKETAKNISDKYKSRAWKREAGIGKAVDKLTKEENEE